MCAYTRMRERDMVYARAYFCVHVLSEKERGIGCMYSSASHRPDTPVPARDLFRETLICSELTSYT